MRFRFGTGSLPSLFGETGLTAIFVSEKKFSPVCAQDDFDVSGDKEVHEVKDISPQANHIALNGTSVNAHQGKFQGMRTDVRVYPAENRWKEIRSREF